MSALEDGDFLDYVKDLQRALDRFPGVANVSTEEIMQLRNDGYTPKEAAQHIAFTLLK